MFLLFSECCPFFSVSVLSVGKRLLGLPQEVLGSCLAQGMNLWMGLSDTENCLWLLTCDALWRRDLWHLHFRVVTSVSFGGGNFLWNQYEDPTPKFLIYLYNEKVLRVLIFSYIGISLIIYHEQNPSTLTIWETECLENVMV